MKEFPQLPLFSCLEPIADALKSTGKAVIAAEPGAGKTMLVPVLVNELAPNGMTIVVEPRRIAARSAAYGMAKLHGFSAGEKTGFAVRGESCRCGKNGILCVTPGILLQMLQHDPSLENVSAIIFDEFHERSCEADLALTFTLDICDSLRDDLMLVIMSATLDSQKSAAFIQAPVITVPGRTFPVDISWRDIGNDLREMPRLIARTVLENLTAGTRNMLVFLPGMQEIEQCKAILNNSLDKNFRIFALHGSLSLADQRAVLAPAPPGIRKIILATNVAESSLTIDDVNCVIDSGWEKCAQWHPGAQMTFLETRRITQASACQRSGRAGRTMPGRAVRCYNQILFNQFPAVRTPEILLSELSGLLLSVLCWGAQPENLRWMDEPPQPVISAAEEVLKRLNLIGNDRRPTAAGKRAAGLPLPPRLAAMMIFAPAELRRTAAQFAAILEEKDDFLHFDSADLHERVSRMLRHPGSYHIQQTIINRLLKEFPPAPESAQSDPGVLIAIAFPEWIARNRTDNGTNFQLANGSAAVLQEHDFLRREEFLAVARLSGSAGADSNIRLALPIAQSTLEKFFSGRITEKCATYFDPAVEKVVSFMERCLDKLPISRRNCPVPRETIVPALLKEAARRAIPLPPADDKRGSALAARLRFAGSCGMDEVPDLTDIYAFLSEITAYFPDNVNTLNDLKKVNYFDLFRSAIDFNTLAEVDRLCPEFFIAPSGHKFPIDYSGDQPSAGVIIQELYPVRQHPTVGRKRIPLRLELLSPARRPVQITGDLPGFWQGSWKLVRAEMRSRYPKHFWPESPTDPK